VVVAVQISVADSLNGGCGVLGGQGWCLSRAADTVGRNKMHIDTNETSFDLNESMISAASSINPQDLGGTPTMPMLTTVITPTNPTLTTVINNGPLQTTATTNIHAPTINTNQTNIVTNNTT
jgi:hypothetical protein